jgi:hypothetical protein
MLSPIGSNDYGSVYADVSKVVSVSPRNYTNCDVNMVNNDKPLDIKGGSFNVATKINDLQQQIKDQNPLSLGSNFSSFA